MTRLQVDAPLSKAPPLEGLCCAAVVSSASSSKGVASLRMMFGDKAVGEALHMAAPWLIGVLSRTVRTILPVFSEADLLEAHRVLMRTQGPAGAHLEFFHYVPPDVRARIIAAVREDELRTMPAAGRA